jgi:RNA polymerase sigma-70 factor, ECF subfamily
MMNGSLPARANRPDRESTESCRSNQARPLAGPPAFNLLYEEHFAFVWRNVRRLGVRQPEIDDVVQEVFIVVHRKLETFEPRTSIRAWIFGILKHVTRTHRRTCVRKQPPSNCEPHLLADVVQLGPEEQLQRSEATRALEVILDSMPEDQREVFILVELEQMNGPEIADALSISVNTVYSRLRTAREHFQRGAASLYAQIRRLP